MRKGFHVVLVCLAVFWGASCFGMARGQAADKVVWTTTNLYYELDSQGSPQDILVIEG